MARRSFTVLTVCTLLGLCDADIVVSRTVNSATIGSGTVTVEGSACTSSDTFGSNNCDVDWGTNYTIDLDLNLSTDIVAGHKFSVDMKVDGLIPFKFSCPLCGADCTITIPLVKKTISFSLPACPIKAGPMKQTVVLPLPASSPLPIKASAKGKVTVEDPSGATVADVDVKATVSPKLLKGTSARKYYVDLDAKGHYGDPATGCMSDEIAVKITGIRGDVCSPPCAGSSCPSDVPSGVTATPVCALQDQSGKKYCILECSPSQKDAAQCGTATCKSIQGVGICTYDD